MIFIVPADHFWRYVKILWPKGSLFESVASQSKCGVAINSQSHYHQNNDCHVAFFFLLSRWFTLVMQSLSKFTSSFYSSQFIKWLDSFDRFTRVTIFWGSWRIDYYSSNAFVKLDSIKRRYLRQRPTRTDLPPELTRFIVWVNSMDDLS